MVEDDYEPPRILKAVRLGNGSSRRRFLVGTLAAGAALAQGCDTSNIEIETADGRCTCHAVCTCDLDSADETNESEQGSEYDGHGNCTCDTVCTCNLVCTCESVGGGGGGGSSTYWY